MVVGIIIFAVLLVIAFLYFAIFKKNRNFTTFKIEDADEDAKNDNKDEEKSEEESESGVLSYNTIEEDVSLDEDDEAGVNTFKKMFGSFEDEDDEDFDFDSIKGKHFDFKNRFRNFNYEDFEDEDDGKERSETLKEIHKMSPKMKAILLSNALDRKYF